MIWFVLVALEVLTLAVYGPKVYKQRLFNMLIALDQAVNVYLGGDPDETISSRAAKQIHKRGWHMLGRVLEWIDPGHLRRAREDDEGDDAAWS